MLYIDLSQSKKYPMPTIPDLYSKLEGTRWSLVSGRHIFSKDVQDLVRDNLELNGREYGFNNSLERLSYLIERSSPKDDRPHLLDLSCLDISEAYQYLDSILSKYSEDGDWEEYKRWYDEGIQFTERLMSLYSKDGSLFLQPAIDSLEAIYRDYKDITKA